MITANHAPSPVSGAGKNEPRFIFDASFEESDAAKTYGEAPAEDGDHSTGFMPDEVTRDCSKRMHYAAWRASESTNRREATRWRRLYHEFRNRIVLGNRKLIYRALQKWHAAPQLADDMASECQIVLINAVAAFNPWLGIRFSTYAFTCLLRALSRFSQRLAADRLSKSVSLDSLTNWEPSGASEEEPAMPETGILTQYLSEENSLLTTREKIVLTLRFHLKDKVPKIETLQQVGRDVGLSKERVRQVQKSAIEKLRSVMLPQEAMA